MLPGSASSAHHRESDGSRVLRTQVRSCLEQFAADRNGEANSDSLDRAPRTKFRTATAYPDLLRVQQLRDPKAGTWRPLCLMAPSTAAFREWLKKRPLAEVLDQHQVRIAVIYLGPRDPLAVACGGEAGRGRYSRAPHLWHSVDRSCFVCRKVVTCNLSLGSGKLAT